ncbi:MAG: hypothetical protein CVU33_19940 [Betaproteobacteria bacterium HGW-Betaproteobacteria-6]|nr:MAG: hypothetical protein CVU33_19940 [Betaproteobacteria bacterium HGW-Betaproteobacteria-6]
MKQTVLIVPGYLGSGPAHWQSWMERQLPATRRVAGIGPGPVDRPRRRRHQALGWPGLAGCPQLRLPRRSDGGIAPSGADWRRTSRRPRPIPSGSPRRDSARATKAASPVGSTTPVCGAPACWSPAPTIPG